WQCSQKISCVSNGKGLFGPNGKRGGNVEVEFDNFGGGGEEIRNCSGNGVRGSSIFRRGGGLFGPNGKRDGKVEVGFDNFGGGGEEIENYSGNGGRGSSMFSRGGGSLAICLMESKDGLGGGGLVVVGERAAGGEVKGGGIDLGVTKSLLGETPRESGGEEF
nr:hypothetical protein [Tanacetum cinerariifolium]